VSALSLLLYETLDNSFIKHNDWIELVWSGIWHGAWTSTAFPTSKPAARPAEAHVLVGYPILYGRQFAKDTI
jgi:hypothetical protein